MEAYYITYLLFKKPPCSSKDMLCVNNVKINTSNCIKPCNGLIVTSFYESKLNKDVGSVFSVLGEYNNYKKITGYPFGYIGN